MTTLSLDMQGMGGRKAAVAARRETPQIKIFIQKTHLKLAQNP